MTSDIAWVAGCPGGWVAIPQHSWHFVWDHGHILQRGSPVDSQRQYIKSQQLRRSATRTTWVNQPSPILGKSKCLKSPTSFMLVSWSSKMLQVFQRFPKYHTDGSWFTMLNIGLHHRIKQCGLVLHGWSTPTAPHHCTQRDSCVVVWGTAWLYRCSDIVPVLNTALVRMGVGHDQRSTNMTRWTIPLILGLFTGGKNCSSMAKHSISACVCS